MSFSKEIEDQVVAVLKSHCIQLVVLRGIPGTGKSTLTRQIQGRGPLGKTHICSVDDYMMDQAGKGKNYKLDPKLLPYCHKQCYDKACQILSTVGQYVIIDNCNALQEH